MKKKSSNVRDILVLYSIAAIDLERRLLVQHCSVEVLALWNDCSSILRVGQCKKNEHRAHSKVPIEIERKSIEKSIGSEPLQRAFFSLSLEQIRLHHKNVTRNMYLCSRAVQICCRAWFCFRFVLRSRNKHLHTTYTMIQMILVDSFIVI